MKKLLSLATLLCALATGTATAQPLEVRARNYKYVVDDTRPGVRKVYDRRRDCLVWRDANNRFLGDARHTITLREKHLLDRNRHHAPAHRPAPPRHHAPAHRPAPPRYHEPAHKPAPRRYHEPAHRSAPPRHSPDRRHDNRPHYDRR